MPVPVSVLILVGLVVFAGYMVFGVTGFGASPITVPVLVRLLPLTFVLALAAILDLFWLAARPGIRQRFLARLVDLLGGDEHDGLAAGTA